MDITPATLQDPSSVVPNFRVEIARDAQGSISRNYLATLRQTFLE